ncbi:glycosyltransferase family A protein [Streptococcus dysgalactiae]|uniref:glycosyltransferase family 2 protein n=1 Tax=Streptococcus dysgalactiae TaxID=1334 RepID=UPI0035D0E28D
MNELVSVVVTCYNHEAYIRQCLESIFKQTEKNIELIVFNDGSTDSSDKIISETLKNSPFKVTKYILQKNKGLVVTRNQAFDLITGKFLLFVDSDNFLEPNYIESMLTEANNKNADIIYTRLINPDNGTVVHDIIPFDLKTFYKFNFIDSCSMVRVSKIKDVRYDEFLNYKKLEDYDFFGI